MKSLKEMQNKRLGGDTDGHICGFLLWNIGLQSSMCGPQGFVLPGFQSCGISLFNG